MARPKPNILLEYTDDSTQRIEEVLEAAATWAVMYKDKPFNLRTSHITSTTQGPKYKKTSFPAPGHAYGLAKRLNTMFKTTDFNVHLMTGGVPMPENGVDLSAFDNIDDDQW